METARLGSYEILRKLTRGGMAELFLARGPEGLVVVKQILPRHAGNPRYVQLFRDEVRLAASLDHPHIVRVYGTGREPDDAFFAMEFLHGQDVRSMLHRAWTLGEKMPIRNAVHVGLHVAAALHYAHEKRRPDGSLLAIVHRDVSPSNIIVSYDGAVKLVDFGVAKAATSSVRTRTGTLKGKISYMSPEQAKGSSIDRRSDVFSLGIVLWEMVTTQRLFRGENDLQTLQLIIHEPPKRPSEMAPECPAELERIILRALSQDASTRYQTAAELHGELEAFARWEGMMPDDAELSSYIGRLFAPEVGAWRHALGAGVSLADHLTSGDESTIALGESDFLEQVDPNDVLEDDLDEDDDEEEDEATEHMAMPPPDAGVVNVVTGSIGDLSSRMRSATAPPPVPAGRASSAALPPAGRQRAGTVPPPVPIGRPSSATLSPPDRDRSGAVPLRPMTPPFATASVPIPVIPEGHRTPSGGIPIAAAPPTGSYPISAPPPTGTHPIAAPPPTGAHPRPLAIPTPQPGDPWPIATGSGAATPSGPFQAIPSPQAYPGYPGQPAPVFPAQPPYPGPHAPSSSGQAWNAFSLDPAVADRLLRRGLWIGAAIVAVIVLVAIISAAGSSSSSDQLAGESAEPAPPPASSPPSPSSPSSPPSPETARPPSTPPAPAAPTAATAAPPDAAPPAAAAGSSAPAIVPRADSAGAGSAELPKKKRPPATKKKAFDPNSPVPP